MNSRGPRELFLALCLPPTRNLTSTLSYPNLTLPSSKDLPLATQNRPSPGARCLPQAHGAAIQGHSPLTGTQAQARTGDPPRPAPGPLVHTETVCKEHRVLSRTHRALLLPQCPCPALPCFPGAQVCQVPTVPVQEWLGTRGFSCCPLVYNAVYLKPTQQSGSTRPGASPVCNQEPRTHASLPHPRQHLHLVTLSSG